MKYLDGVRLTVSRKQYEELGLTVGSLGAIVMPEIRGNMFEVEFFEVNKKGFEVQPIYVGDLEVTRESNVTDEDILDELPNHDPAWWCKVENGYIVNLKGKRKNKIPYDYKS